VGVNGLLNVNKPVGWTSFDVVARIRRFTGERRVGHAGTLDPAATGVLPICLGQATRLTEYLHNYPKEYIAVIRLGLTTDTFDGEGAVTGGSSADLVTLRSVQEALGPFQGTIDQVPPAYSAIKIKGTRSYKLARSGIEVPLQPRQVRIDSIEILDFELPNLKIKITCSKGTYIRSLANNLGQALGCGAYLDNLIRTVCGPFKLEGSVTPEDIASSCAAGNLESLLHPVDYPLYGWRKHVVDADISRQIQQGHNICLNNEGTDTGEQVAVYDTENRLLAIMKFVPDTGLWHPQKVFRL
jgi:tRNA pseudouridine55 synthase